MVGAMSRQIGMHIGGKEVAAVGGQWFDTVDPFPGQVCEVALGDTRDVQAANRATRPHGGRAGRPDDVADAVEYFVSDLAGWVSGQHLLVSGGAPQ